MAVRIRAAMTFCVEIIALELLMEAHAFAIFAA